MSDGAAKAIQFYQETQSMFAVIFGMFVQFFLGDRRGFRIAVTIVISSIFVALFLLPAAFEFLGLSATSKPAIAIYALSAAISSELLALIIIALRRVLPTVAEAFISKLGVRNER